MKDNLFELLLSLFETSMTQIQESLPPVSQELSDSIDEEKELAQQEHEILFIKESEHQSTRVFTYEEQVKLTKSSHQFLIRLKSLGVIDEYFFEAVINQLEQSDSHIVTLRELKWTVRTVLSTHLDEKQLAFLDLVLYHQEDNVTMH
jgi:uncharacterized protein Smg (DUF494 family)